MSDTNNRSGLFVGLNKGFLVKTPAKMAWKTRPVTKKGKVSKRATAVRQVIREVAGFSPLEKRMLEMIRTGIAAKDKKAVKIARQKLGTHQRATKKKEELSAVIQLQRKKN
mmetsp:Transcript_15405/g.26035  ORF Transcript_15405/g.26035 Transcript_15405/m.26035 type:complete len:111 (-) Transcript_15405:108-440(-)